MGRYKRVTVLGETSDSLPVISGIPEGSILGPMLFLIYVNNLPDSVLTSHVAMFQGHPTDLFGKLSVRKVLNPLQFS